MKALAPVSASSFRIVCEGPEGAIRLSPAAYDAYMQAIDGKDEIAVKRKTHLGRYFRIFCDEKHHFRFLNDEKFKKEINFTTSNGVAVAVWTFKAWQWRVYGAVFEVEGKRCFVGVEVDPNKKQNRADRAKLKSAAEAVAALSDYTAGRRER